MKRAIALSLEVFLSDSNSRITRVNAVQRPNAWRDRLRPAPTAAPQVEADRVIWQRVPWKDREILGKDPFQLVLRKSRLVKGRPFVTKPSDGLRVNVAHIGVLPGSVNRQ